MSGEDKEKLKKEIKRLKKKLKAREKDLEEMKISNLFMGALFDGISEEIMVVDPHYNIRDTNKTFLDAYGLSKDTAIGKKCYEVKGAAGAPCDANGQDCPMKRAQVSGEMVEMAHIHRSPAGDEKEFFLMMYPLKSKGREVDSFIEISRDVTEYRKLIKKVKASEKRFKAILDTANDAIISVDEEQRIVLFNNAAERIFGYSRGEILGKNLNILIPPHYGDHSRYIKRFIKSRESNIIGKTLSLTGLRKSGEEFPLELGLSYLEKRGDITFTAIIRDVSEQQKLEKKLLQSERLAAVGHSTSHVAHELKNPLMIIGGFTSQIKRSMSEEQDIKKLDMILDEVMRLEKLVVDLGDFTKQYKLVKRQADLNAVLMDVTRIMSGIYPSDIFSFERRLADDLVEISCDPDKLKQVFINLISNGFEAMKDGGTLEISTEMKESGLEIRFRDNGTGIPDEELQHIFEPFYTTREKGHGLGLAISYRIVEAHHGEIAAISSPGEGTTFILRLPAR